MKKMKTVSRSE